MIDAAPADARAVARLHVRAWQVAYRGLLPDEHLDSLSVEQRAARYRFGSGPLTTALARESGDLLGFVTFGPAGDEAGAGQVHALYVDPAAWRRGTGAALLEHAQNRLRAAGFGAAMLWVLAANDRARSFYARHGWRPDGGRRTECLGGRAVDEVRHRRRPL
nr:GNAT family N-acetyltransferase [Saccharopolyspora sp. HNM0983]